MTRSTTPSTAVFISSVMMTSAIEEKRISSSVRGSAQTTPASSTWIARILRGRALKTGMNHFLLRTTDGRGNVGLEFATESGCFGSALRNPIFESDRAVGPLRIGSAVLEVTAKFVELTPLNFTAVAPVKFKPLIVTTVPTVPVAGVKLAMVGAATKVAALVAVPPGVVTLSGPVVTPDGAVA